jgi:hypothetical protein
MKTTRLNTISYCLVILSSIFNFSSVAQSLNGMWIGVNCKNLIIQDNKAFINGYEDSELSIELKGSSMIITEESSFWKFIPDTKEYIFRIDHMEGDTLILVELNRKNGLFSKEEENTLTFVRYEE